jgi:hypothetical protein
MIYFIESSFPAYLCRYLTGGIFIYTSNSIKFAPNGKGILIKPLIFFKVLKIIFSILRFKCVFQGASGIAYHISKSKIVISDGILTEFLFRAGHIKPKKFISINCIKPELSVKKNHKIILGNNFVETGNFSLVSFEKYLKEIKNKFPDALYFPHPKENLNLARDIFGDKIILSDSNIESYCNKKGIPEYIIGFIGSTAMASLALLSNEELKIEYIKVEDMFFDGANATITDPFLFGKGIEVNIEILEQTVLSIIEKKTNIIINKHVINLV